MAARIGIDVGGTFTDLCAWDGRTIRAYKTPTTPHDLLEGIGSALDAVALRGDHIIVQGSTIATNALLERRGARTALITTEGFRDLLHIGRQDRPRLYDLRVRRPAPIVRREDCFEVPERIGADGRILRPLDEQAAARLVSSLRERGIESVAVCLLFSFLEPRHEQRIGEMCRQAGIPATLSADLLPEMREFERASTTAVNAYVMPLVESYLLRLDEAVRRRGATALRIMQSNGGQISPAHAAAQPVRTILSGPAGGVIAAWRLARTAGFHRIVTYDCGGTSTDVCLIDGRPAETTEAHIDGWPIRVPVIDIHTIGAGGGSIAHLDPAGVLQVGPQSAGADPGPACYGRGDQPTVTDANLVLGRLVPETMLGGRMPLFPDRAADAIGALARQMGVALTDAARGILRVVNAGMERAIRRVTAARGHDPRDYWLFCFGGAAGLHACELADALQMPGVLVPPQAGVLSAYGMIAADMIRDFSISLPQRRGRRAEVDLTAVRRHFADLMEQAALLVQLEGYEQDDSILERYADMRYRGQSHEITVPVESLTDVRRFVAPFHAEHRRRFGYADESAPVEVVTLRLRAIVSAPPLPPLRPSATAPRLATEAMPAGPVIPREQIPTDRTHRGPAVIVEDYATTWLPPGWQARTLPDGMLELTRAT